MRAIFLLVATGLLAIVAPILAPHDPTTQFADKAYAPPTRIHLRDATGFRAPFFYKQTLVNRLAREYADDTSAPISLRWFSGGRVATSGDSTEPVLLLGADALGRDVFSRLVSGARWSLGVTALGVLGALLVGILVGGLAGTAGGRVDSMLMGASNWLLAMPGAYLVLVLRGALPLVLTTGETFALISILFTVATWPHVARGVRGIVAAERAREYAEAARASGAGLWRLMSQLLPAARGFLAVETVLLVPALLVAEATVSYLSLGFPDASASWGTLLQDVNVRVMSEAPWMLAPAAGIFAATLIAQAAGARVPQRA
ncbi:MAG TPA: ABC transporter permease [Vicinamibacterales bacterium]|nr:ABC transporter permease [Vicinamibacterales bacterium]